MHVVRTDRDVGQELAFEARRDFVGVRRPSIGIVPRGSRVAEQLSARIELVQLRLVDHGTVDQKWIRRKLSVSWAIVRGGRREVHDERAGEGGAGIEPGNDLEMRLVEKPSVS